jgi:Ser/Thr protein kinase RdoA (MazF antagonist)
LRRGVVHHDGHGENVLFGDNRLVALIDFDDAHMGYLLEDVAVIITNWADDGAPGDPLNLPKATVAREYQRHRPFADTERGLLPDFTLLYLLCDAVGHVRGALERGIDGNAAVAGCNVYKCYLHHARDADWTQALREAL